MTEKGRKRKNRSGPGRPPVFDNPVYTAFWMEREDKERLYEQKGTLPVGVYVGMLLRSKNAEKAVLMRKLAEKDNEISALKKERESLLNALEKERQARERAEKEAEYWKQKYYELKGEKQAHTYNEGKLLRALAEHAREGISWADLCAEVLDLRDEKKMKRLMGLAFDIKTTKKNTYATKFYPKRTAPEFKGWVLVRPEKSDGPVLLIDYELYREDTLKVAKAINKGEAVPEVKPLKTGKAAERWLATFFEVVERQYMGLLNQKRGKEAKEFLEESVPTKLEKVLQDIDPADWRRAVLAVLDELEARAEGDGKLEAFVSNLRRVVLRALKEAESHAPVLEVKADV